MKTRGPLLCLLLLCKFTTLRSQYVIRQTCGATDFRCDSGKCIEGASRCNGVVDCPTGEDERNCTCREDEFKCADDGTCIESRKKCDGVNHCNDGSDEQNCACGSDKWQCDHGSCIKRSKRCDGRVDCPTDRSDERNCMACGDGDFKCGNGYCIPAPKRCDRTHDCQDGSDEQNCIYGTVCMAYEYKCSSGDCVEAESRCNGTVECKDSSDEWNCSCKRDQFKCRDGTCINIGLRCNGRRDCHPLGEDEHNCASCPPHLPFTCDRGSRVLCAIRCDGRQECDTGEDEFDCGCKDDEFQCRNGMCINKYFKCDKNYDCDDQSDEENCLSCNEYQFQCRDGTCIENRYYCDNRRDCPDNSDEDSCPLVTSSPPIISCSEYEFQCRDGTCIDKRYYCDNRRNCPDNSDEDSCPLVTSSPPITRSMAKAASSATRASSCHHTEFTCEEGRCIPLLRRCDNFYDCSDFSDEQNCLSSGTSLLRLRVYPDSQEVRYGGDVVFTCHDEGDLRIPVRWTREDGRPLRAGVDQRIGRLDIIGVTKSDAGVYICEPTGYPGYEIKVTLIVRNPPATPGPFHPTMCKATEATCNNGQCISKSKVCNGVIDCDDASDEACNHRVCEPNEFQCGDGSCVLKTWVCDSESDCKDGSDEENCTSDPQQQCLITEFACRNKQCVNRSYHCDDLPDCIDKSDELGCSPIFITRPPSPANVRLNIGETLTLVCEAVGVPAPLISWRLNWGHVPDNCVATNANSTVGTLICRNMQPEHSGAYSCEAINNRGTIFATRDSNVTVDRAGSPCPPGYFNSEARSESECIRCFCFGESTQCKSADLFTFNMPTLLGEGGTRLVGVRQSYNGDVQIDKEQITNQYYYLPQRNGATVTKVEYYSPTVRGSNAYPYVTLPESYNKNQLTSYGGHIKYTLTPHSPMYGLNDNVPDIIIVGKYRKLVYFHRGEKSRKVYIEARLTPGNWQKTESSGLSPASREDIMMALDDIQSILLRADVNNAGVNITDFTMESAHNINVGLGVASLVEECSCPPGYEGLSCQKCAAGYERQSFGAWLGNCVPKRPTCPPLTYGDPTRGFACTPCPCPLTNSGNQFATGCSVGPRGDVICDCHVGYEGSDCSVCASGYEGNPMIPGDSCKIKPTHYCNPEGTNIVRMPDECECKKNVQGRYCDQCMDGSFYLSRDFRYGCALCFCSGVSQQCMSSSLRRKTTTVRFNMPQIADQVKIYESEPVSAVRFNAAVEADIQPEFVGGEIALNELAYRPSIYYWSLPVSFAGDKVTSYGGFLRYTLRHVAASGGQGTRNNAADIQLISNNTLTFHYFGNFAPSSDGYVNASVQLLETGWQRHDGKEITRENFLLALADVKTILIKATYTANTEMASIVSASIDTAEANGDGPLALHVEQCVCPRGYIGTSCEDCAAGFTSIYLEHCEPCDCNGQSNMCHPETGVCYNCRGNTAGEKCELCSEGYVRDQYNNCVRQSPVSCNCDPRGTDGPCDVYGQCNCKENVEGESCDRCRDGTFDLDANNPQGCIPCYCSGVTSDCHEASHYTRIPMAAPIFGENYGGYTLMDYLRPDVIKDEFVPAPYASELSYIFQSPTSDELYWSLPVFPGNRVLSYGGTLSLRQKYETGGYPDQSMPGKDVILISDEISLYWSNPTPIKANESLSYQVPLVENGWYILDSALRASRHDFMGVLSNLRRVLVRATLSPYIYSTSIADVSMDTATESNDPDLPVAKGVEMCICPPGYTGTSCEQCSSGYYKERSGNCAQCECNGHDCSLSSNDEVLCNCRPPYSGPDCSTIGNDMTVPTVSISPYMRDYYEGDRIELICTTSGNPAPTVSWQRTSGRPLPRTAEVNNFFLIIDNANVDDSGEYRCIASNRAGSRDVTAIVNVQRKSPWQPRELITISPTSPSVAEGQSTNVICTGTPDIPAGSLEWIRQDGTPLLQNVKSINGVLTIRNAVLDNQGVYLCQSISASYVQPGAVTINVFTTRTYDEPNVTLSKNSLSIPTGEIGTIECTPRGYPLPQIIWKKHNGTFGSGTTQRDYTLIISNAQDSDRGYYVCEGIANQATISIAYVYVDIERREPPIVEIYPKDEQAVGLGSLFDLQCRVVGGVPEPIVTWSRPRQLTPTTEILKNNVLRFKSIVVNDEGEYICTAQNVAGSASASTVIKVRSSPEITLMPSDYMEAEVGQQVRVECRADGYPEPQVSIKRGSDYNDRVVVVQPSPRSAILMIRSVSESDAGDYTCIASSGADTIENQFVIRVESRIEGSGDPEPFSPEPRPNNMIAIEGQNSRISCQTSDEFEVMWTRRDRQPLQYNARQEGTELIIYNSSKSDNGQYECILINRMTKETEKSAYTSLLVMAPPTISLRPKSQTVQPGQSTVVECVVSGDDIMSILWRPLSKTPSRRVEIRNTTLIFHQIEIDDAGEYECFAMNRVANESAVAEVYVSEDNDRVPWESHDNEQKAHVGADVRLSCNVTQPGLTIQWTKDDRPLPASVTQNRDSSLSIRRAQKSDSGRYVCLIWDRSGRHTSNYINLHIEGPRYETPSLVSIEQPRRSFRVGDKVEVQCRARKSGTVVKWERYGTNEFVHSTTYRDSALLMIPGVEDSDAGVYRCTGQDRYGIVSYEDFNLEVIPGPVESPYPEYDGNAVYTARLRDSIDLPCSHNLEEPVSIDWRREYSPLQGHVRNYESTLHLDSVTEADAGTYICRVSNRRMAVEARATLRVVGVVPRFGGYGWLTLPTLKDAYINFNIEISFKPMDGNGLILYNGGRNLDGTVDFLALQLVDGVPQLTLETSSGPIVVRGDRPVQLNAWHTVRLSRTKNRVTMDVDNTGPFSADSSSFVLDLSQPLYIGGTDDLPPALQNTPNFVGCVSMLIHGREEKNITMDSINSVNVMECETCTPNLCLNDGVCQEARNEHGYMCICAPGFAGIHCDRPGEACRPGLCGPGKCTDTADGYKCTCPIPYAGKNCDNKQSIEYPAFTGSAFLAIRQPETSRYLRMSMKVKATSPVTDGIIMYCAQTSRGYGGFTSLAVRNRKLEFRYDVGDGSPPIVLTSNQTLAANEWTDVNIARTGNIVSLKINMKYNYEDKLESPEELRLETPMFVGGVDDSIVLNNNTGVTGGFNGCIKDVMLHDGLLDLVNSSILSANVQECVNHVRGDIPEMETICQQCQNGGSCPYDDSTSCTCPEGFTGAYCETRVPPQPPRRPSDPCAARPCRNRGTCRPDWSARMNYSCDCPLGFAGINCHLALHLLQSVGFNGDGYLELPSQLVTYNGEEPATLAIAFHTLDDGVLLYQHEQQAQDDGGDYIMLRVEGAVVVMEWNLGGGASRITVDNVVVTDDERHTVIAKLYNDQSAELSVDNHPMRGTSNGMSSVMNADSNIYIGGMPDYLNYEHKYPGLNGCIEQVELMQQDRSLNLGEVAVTGRNTQMCKEPSKYTRRYG